MLKNKVHNIIVMEPNIEKDDPFNGGDKMHDKRYITNILLSQAERSQMCLMNGWWHDYNHVKFVVQEQIAGKRVNLEVDEGQVLVQYLGMVIKFNSVSF